MYFRNETELHKEVVKYIRANFPDLLIDAGLGELQNTSEKRIDAWEKGYTAGKPDLLIFNHSGPWKGFAIEFKNPRYLRMVSEKQKIYLEKLRKIGWKTLITNDYLECLNEIENYYMDEEIKNNYYKDLANKLLPDNL